MSDADPNKEGAAATASATTALGTRPLLHYKELSLGSNRKVKFTCVHASDNFLACGTTTGSVYLYATSATTDRSSASTANGAALNAAGGSFSTFVVPAKYHLVKLISPPSAADRVVSVSCLSICPMQKRLVVGTTRGAVYGIQLSDYHKIGEKVEFTHDFHTGFPVTCLLWDRVGQRLYSACNSGLVCQTTMRAGRMSALFGGTAADTELLLKEESGVVQLDMGTYGRADILLVSSQLRVLLLNLSSSEGSAVQIGTKSRQGNYGACFFTARADDAEAAKRNMNTRVFSARPGRRVWIADPQTGTVSATLKFALAKSPTAFLQNPGCQMEDGIQPRDLTINKLSLFQFLQDPSYFSLDSTQGKGLLVSWSIGSSVLFFLDPIGVEIVEWHLDLGIIHDLKVINDSALVILHGELPKVSIIQSCTARQFLDIYAGEDMKRAVEIAIEFEINDALVLEILMAQWREYLGKSTDAALDAMSKLTADLETRLQQAKDMQERYIASKSIDAAAAASKPLQVIFKQRPQQQVERLPPDLFASNGNNTNPGTNVSADTSVVLNTNALHKATEYFDAVSPILSYSRNIYTPDGSTLEARLIEIKDVSNQDPIVRDDYRDAWMEEITYAVRRFEAKAKEDEGINHLIKGGLYSGANAAKALSTFIPGAGMISNFMDTATVSQFQPGRASAINMFGDLPDMGGGLVLDPVIRKPPKKKREVHEYPVLRIAMSSISEMESSNLDSEVLLEAISMDIWDSKLKYISNLPLDKQMSLPEAEAEELETERVKNQKSNKSSEKQKSMLASQPSLRRVRSAENLNVDTVTGNLMQTNDDEKKATAKPPVKRSNALLRRNSLSPDAGRSAQRALQKYIGGGPSCYFQLRCMVNGQLAILPELEPLLKREIVDLISELQSAAATAVQTAHLTRRLWPASGITRVCACLSNMFLFHGDLPEAQKSIKLWLSCFDPTAKPEEQVKKSPSQPMSKGKLKSDAKKSVTASPMNGGSSSGFARGEALLDGDGLPLTRSDWTYVRVLVTIYFAICTAGYSNLIVRPARDDEDDKPYAYEMGFILAFRSRECQGGAENARSGGAPTWSPKEVEEFVLKYGIYLNTALAAEICSIRQLGGALNAVLDQVVSSAHTSDTCDMIVNWIAEKKIDKAIDLLKESDSLCLLLHVLDLMLKKCPNEAIELCVTKYPALTPWNIERCLFGSTKLDAAGDDQELLKAENLPQTAKYFRYLVRLLECCGESIGEDEALVNLCIRLCFCGVKVTGKIFEEDNRVSIAVWLQRLLRQPHRFKIDHEKTWALCRKHHVYEGLLELTCTSLVKFSTPGTSLPTPEALHELQQLVAVIVQDKQLTVLEDLFVRLSGVDNKEQILFTSVLGQVEHGIEKGDEELTATVIHALLNATGTEAGMSLLARFPLLFAGSPLSMYQTIVEAHVLSQRQDREVQHMLEAIDTNVWASYKEASSGSRISFPPQIQAIMDLECGGLESVMDASKYANWNAKVTQYDDEIRQHREKQGEFGGHGRDEDLWITLDQRVKKSASRSFEYRNSDWGGEVQLHDANCALCGLTVVLVAQDDCNLEMVLLPCGHAFHSTCLDDAACPTCLATNLESLDAMW